MMCPTITYGKCIWAETSTYGNTNREFSGGARQQGTVVSVTDTLAVHNVNLGALSIVETGGFGILRLIVDNEEAAEQHTYVVLRGQDNAKAESIFQQAGYHIITEADVNEL
mgnify:CR=1 FL=1